MKKIIGITLLCLAPLSVNFASDNVQGRVEQSKSAVQELAGKLMKEMKTAMQAGGPVQAIKACNESAPLIASEISEKYNWQVGRTSLKLRNPANAPDAWEEAVLKKFAERRAAGESPEKMAYFEVVEEKGQKNFRFMKAIGMPPLAKMPCLICHGDNIDSTISTKLNELYPNDKAVGYKAGEIRGAFTITQPM